MKGHFVSWGPMAHFSFCMILYVCSLSISPCLCFSPRFGLGFDVFAPWSRLSEKRPSPRLRRAWSSRRWEGICGPFGEWKTGGCLVSPGFSGCFLLPWVISTYGHTAGMSCKK